jgi:pimeloyl-ACP methyl ester carboxylesterase
MADEMRALTRLAVEELHEATGGIGAVHRAIADRAFVGRGASKALHDGIAGAVYAAVRGGMTVAGRAADASLAVGVRREVPPALLGVLNGLRGDALEREGSPLALGMTAEGGEASPRLAVFVHGLFETELAWRYGGGPTYGERLAADHDLAPVHVRYNSGRHVSENGRLLADLLAAWPHPLEHVVLVGHSMGGLVARSACHIAGERGDDWVRHVTHVVSLGSPHTGAPLESAVHYAAAALGVLPETKPFARGLRRRSAGIRDLRRGSLVDEDWRDRDPEALRAAACREVPLLGGVTHCFVAATITSNPRHPVARVLGDWLVLEASASHRAQQSLHVGGAHHLALLNHPQVYARLSEWLATAPQRALPATPWSPRAQAS